MEHLFASLAHIRILLLPVGNIQRATFDGWAGDIKDFEEIRLSDVPADSREDRARFMPNPLATGTLFLSFLRHPPSPSCGKLDLFRPSEFPLGVVGIANCSQSDALSSIYSQFNGTLAELFPPDSIFPLARNCFVFEEGDGNTNLNIGNHMPGLVVIPSMMGNKKLYIGTLLAELCSNILGEFSMMIKTLESSAGTDALNAGLLARMPLYKSSRASLDAQDAGRPSSVASPLHTLPENGLSTRQSDPRLNMKRASTLGPGIGGTSNRSSQQMVQSKRQGTLSSSSTKHARLYKVLGDLFLLAGRTMDASIWYNEAVHVLKQPQDLMWQASALEGVAIAGVIDAWSTINSPVTANNQLADTWRDLAEKLSSAVSLYYSAAEVAEAEGCMPELSFLYINACIRHASLMYYMCLADGMHPLAFDGLLHGRMGDRQSDDKIRLNLISGRSGISRSDISEILAQAHGPWLLHLSSRERIGALRGLAQMYSGLFYRRKEAYVLRELLACLMDLVVQGREEARGSSDLSLVASNSSSPNVAIKENNVGVRERDDVVGNASILRLVKYVCEVHGVDLGHVRFATSGGSNERQQRPSSEIRPVKHQASSQPSRRYTWSELQVGLIRESLAVAEALPDYAAVVLFALSALQDLYSLLDPEDQFHFHTAASRALATLRRRGDDRKLGYWLDELILNVRYVPMPFGKLPLERPWSDIQEQAGSGEELARTDPFLFNPRRLLSNKRQAFAVANELIEFVVTLENPYSVALDILEVQLSTSGAPFVGKPQPVVIPGNSFETVTLSGQATEAGILVVRGCSVLLPGTERHETLLPILSEDEEESRFLKAIANLNEEGRSKTPSLNERFDRRRKHTSAISSDAGEKAPKPIKYLELKIVPEQPYLRIRRTSLTNGAVMVYDGETSIIRLTVENVSSLPIDFLDLSFEDSTKAQLEQLLNEDLNAFDTYETEYSLVQRPVFSWEPDKTRKDIPPGKESVILVKCFGKAGCTDGTIHISYSYAHRPRDGSNTPQTAFYTRQLLFPVLVSVYQMLECSGMNILPLSALADAEDVRNEWGSLLADIDDVAWCVLALDVQNMYGLAFEVILSYNSEVSTSRVIPPGSTYRLLLPIERFSLLASACDKPIPSLMNRQFVVSGLASDEDKAQRELFWHREELLKRVHASWKEAAGSRTGELSLRQQRFTQPMLNTLRMDDIRVSLSLSDIQGSESSTHGRGTYVASPNEYVVVTATVQNLTPSSLVLSLSLSAEPSESVLYDGSLKDIPLGRIASQESKEHQATVIFVAQGNFRVFAQVREVVVGQESRVCGMGHIVVESRDD
ncbi:Trs120-domain-containing protein [Fomitiporia mediterranea MF3/22]|uniref:Trs120-domain-containing protein n=1 Tax=Fomitiporia mediterranea (strain MF3/22) TaxID=694068 RepID=UPI0004409428|nr:Trs120-domain-containing protein [Fomitiporia mediterranea MF3/22]EJD06035.1 Trs120-domain-containing protein [Fomitiporia mediterranea MF3/22]